MLDKIGFGCCAVGALLGIAALLWPPLEVGTLAVGLILLGMLLRWIAGRSDASRGEMAGEVVGDLLDGADVD
ncbi:MAG TPA: hypothetical protein VGC21_13105 [Telluria sp.]|jgi:hypothetical protein